MTDEKNTTQDEANRQKDAKERASKSATEVQERVAKAYDHEDPTPTQEENDQAKLAAMGDGGSLMPVGDSGWQENPLTAKPDTDAKKKQSEAEKPAGGSYQTRTVTSPQPTTPKAAG